ncbi:titin [Forsythia ovata]|uniref:Titin n=1 Tax=Forsythia ovata TaxID=205694 RepID=A0ABD1UEY6_9LAMI
MLANDDQKMTSKPDDIESQMMDREHDTTIRSEATADETIKICQEVNDDQKMTSKPDDIETQVMDGEHDTAIQSEATADETTKIFQETTELKVIDSSENIEEIILLDENRNQHVSVASILEEKIAEISEGDKTITDIPSQEVRVSYQKHDGCIDSSTQIIDKDSGAKDNLTVLSAEETETEVSYEEEKKIKEPDTEVHEPITMHFFIRVMQNPESVEPTIELPSTSEPVIEFQVIC